MIDERLYFEIQQYCELNGILDVNKEINSMLQRGFNLVKYGSSPFEKMREQQELPSVQEEVKESIKPIKKRSTRTKTKVEEESIIPSEKVQEEGDIKVENKEEVVEKTTPKRKVRVIKNK